MIRRSAWHRQKALEDFVSSESETELWGRSHDTCWTSLEEGLEAFLLPYSLRAMPQGYVAGIALSRLNLETGLDDVAGSGEVGGWHTSDGTSGEELQDAELFRWRFAEVVALEMIIGREIDGGKGNVTEETGRGSFVEAHKTKVLHNPHGGTAGDTFDGLGDFALHLKTDLDDL
jgi:hypothetical protein